MEENEKQIEETTTEEKTEETKQSSGLSNEQVEERVDSFKAQEVALRQEKILLTFDSANYKDTLDRKFRANKRNMKLVMSNLNVVEKELAEFKDNEGEKAMAMAPGE